LGGGIRIRVGARTLTEKRDLDQFFIGGRGRKRRDTPLSGRNGRGKSVYYQEDSKKERWVPQMVRGEEGKPTRAT